MYEERIVKEKILKKIRAALVSNSPQAGSEIEPPVPYDTNTDLLLEFLKVISTEGARFFYAENKIVFAEQLVTLFDNMKWDKAHYQDIQSYSFISEFQFPAEQVTNISPAVVLANLIQMCNCAIHTGEFVFYNQQIAVQRALEVTNNLIIFFEAKNMTSSFANAIKMVEQSTQSQCRDLFITSVGQLLQMHNYNEHNQKVADKSIYIFIVDELPLA
ncbi:MAG: hypothetical protein IPO27_15860 [Bacteroidetes bacterium]|nr:hypothetical protein [Bacteroidota bacterium]